MYISTTTSKYDTKQARGYYDSRNIMASRKKPSQKEREFIMYIFVTNVKYVLRFKLK